MCEYGRTESTAFALDESVEARNSSAARASKADVVVREHHALGIAGGTRRVDEHRQVVGLHRTFGATGKLRRRACRRLPRRPRSRTTATFRTPGRLLSRSAFIHATIRRPIPN